MFKTIQSILAIAASVAIPSVMAQTTSSDQQVMTPKPVPKMTEEEKKADKAAKRAPAAKPAPGSPTVSSDEQVLKPKATTKMTAEEKKADKAAKRKPPTPEEQDAERKKAAGG